MKVFVLIVPGMRLFKAFGYSQSVDYNKVVNPQDATTVTAEIGLSCFRWQSHLVSRLVSN